MTNLITTRALFSPTYLLNLVKSEIAAILENSNGDVSAADRPIYTVFGSNMGFSGSADFNSGLTEYNRYVGENNARVVIRLVTI